MFLPVWHRSLHPQTSIKRGSVCLACQRQWQQPLAQWSQLRWSSAGGTESWSDTLNDINDIYTCHSSVAKRKPKQNRRISGASHVRGSKDAVVQSPTGLVHLATSESSQISSEKAALEPKHRSVYSKVLSVATAERWGAAATRAAKQQSRQNAPETLKEHNIQRPRIDIDSATVNPPAYFNSNVEIYHSSTTTDTSGHVIQDAYEKQRDGSIQPRMHLFQSLVARLRNQDQKSLQQQDQEIELQHEEEACSETRPQEQVRANSVERPALPAARKTLAVPTVRDPVVEESDSAKDAAVPHDSLARLGVVNMEDISVAVRGDCQIHGKDRSDDAPISENDAFAAAQSTGPVGVPIGEAMRGGVGAGSHGNGDDNAGKPSSSSSAGSPAKKDGDASEVSSMHSDYVHAEMLPADLEVKPLDIPQPPVPYLQYGLDRVLFNPGVYHLQDPASRVYNFDPYLQKIMPVTEFDFNALKEYKTSSEDVALSAIAKEQGKKFIGSTSSMTSVLAHLHYLISDWRPLNLDMLSSGYVGKDTSTLFTRINRAPSAIFLRYKDGRYAIDVDKEFDHGNVLMLLGKSMELFLTSPKDEYEKYRKSDPRTVSEEQRTAPESYQYTTMGDFLMRSQLDAYDPRLPDNGTFDLKTRAVVSVRMQAHDPEEMTGYEIFANQGRWGSYEKEFHDMMRATMLKYMLQARMGRMNGIFVAYHNVKRMFGFQYLPMHEMDRAIHGQSDTCLGDQEFKASLKLLNELLLKATARFPNQSLRIHFETQDASREKGKTPASRKKRDPPAGRRSKRKIAVTAAAPAATPTALHMWAEPITEDQIEEIQAKPKERIAQFERNIMGKEEADSVPTNSTDEAISDNVKFSEDESPELDTFVGAEGFGNAAMDMSSVTDPGSSKQRTKLRSEKKPRTASEGELAPLFFASTIVQTLVNGKIMPDGRPSDLKNTDKWQLEYLIQSKPTTREHWAMYEDMKARRKRILSVREPEDDVDESPNAGKMDDQFIAFLKKMSAQSSKVREMMDERDAGKEILRSDQPLPQHREKIETVEDYMKWLYSGKQT